MKDKRELAIKWWNDLSFEDKFYKLIEFGDDLIAVSDRHPDRMTGREIEIVWDKFKNNP